jgi:hypothetical protein
LIIFIEIMQQFTGSNMMYFPIMHTEYGRRLTRTAITMPLPFTRMPSTWGETCR